MYVITDGERYIIQNGNNSFDLTTYKSRAKQWNYDKACNILKNNINSNKILKKYNMKVVALDEHIIPSENSPLGFDIREQTAKIGEMCKQLEERRRYLSARLSSLDMELVDVQHAAEFYTLNACQGYKLYKVLHDVRVERRDVKNELEQIGYLLGSGISSEKMQNVEKCIAGMEHRQYTPRVNKAIFEI